MFYPLIDYFLIQYLTHIFFSFFLQAYLSHPIISDVMEKMGSDFEGGFYSRGTQVLEKLPIINVDFENEKEKAL